MLSFQRNEIKHYLEAEPNIINDRNNTLSERPDII